jgi:hypothetical protein
MSIALTFDHYGQTDIHIAGGCPNRCDGSRPRQGRGEKYSAQGGNEGFTKIHHGVLRGVADPLTVPIQVKEVLSLGE